MELLRRNVSHDATSSGRAPVTVLSGVFLSA